MALPYPLLIQARLAAVEQVSMLPFVSPQVTEDIHARAWANYDAARRRYNIALANKTNMEEIRRSRESLHSAAEARAEALTRDQWHSSMGIRITGPSPGEHLAMHRSDETVQEKLARIEALARTILTTGKIPPGQDWSAEAFRQRQAWAAASVAVTPIPTDFPMPTEPMVPLPVAPLAPMVQSEVEKGPIVAPLAQPNESFSPPVVQACLVAAPRSKPVPRLLSRRVVCGKPVLLQTPQKKKRPAKQPPMKPKPYSAKLARRNCKMFPVSRRRLVFTPRV